MKSYLEAKNLEELCALMGLPESEAPKLKIRLDLTKAIRRTIEKKKMTHAEAADQTGFYLHVECSSWSNQSTTIGEGKPFDKYLYEF